MCTEERKQVAAAADEEHTQLAVPAPGLLALPKEELDDTFQVFPKTDAIVVEDGGWTWTFKLTAVKSLARPFRPSIPRRRIS